MAEHPNVAAVRRVRTGILAGDLGPVLDTYASDVVWTNDSGAGPWAGEHRGLDKVLPMLEAFMQLFGGAVTQDVVDTLVGREHVAEIVTTRAERGGQRFEHRAVFVYRFRDGRIVEQWTLDHDRDGAAAFWASLSGTV